MRLQYEILHFHTHYLVSKYIIVPITFLMSQYNPKLWVFAQKKMSQKYITNFIGLSMEIISLFQLLSFQSLAKILNRALFCLNVVFLSIDQKHISVNFFILFLTNIFSLKYILHICLDTIHVFNHI